MSRSWTGRPQAAGTTSGGRAGGLCDAGGGRVSCVALPHEESESAVAANGSSLRSRMVDLARGREQHHRTRDGAQPLPLAHVAQPGRLEDRGKPAGHVVARALESVEQLRGEEGQAHQWIAGSPVGDVKLALRTQDASDLGGRALLHLPRQVMEHERRDHAVEARVLERKIVGERLAEADVEPRLVGLLSRPLEHGGVAVDPHELGARLAFLDPDVERPRAAPDVEYALAGLETRLFEQALL